MPPDKNSSDNTEVYFHYLKNKSFLIAIFCLDTKCPVSGAGGSDTGHIQTPVY